MVDSLFLKEAAEQCVEKRPNNRVERLPVFVTGKEADSCDEQRKLVKCGKFMKF